MSSDAEAELKHLRRVAQGYKGLLTSRGYSRSQIEAVASGEEASPSGPRYSGAATPSTPELGGERVPRERGVHAVRSYQRNCTEPGCGLPNEDFKDEVECADCHRSQGKLKYASKRESCWNCGSKKGRVKLDEFFECDTCSKPIAATLEEARAVEACPGCGGRSVRKRR